MCFFLPNVLRKRTQQILDNDQDRSKVTEREGGFEILKCTFLLKFAKNSKNVH